VVGMPLYRNFWTNTVVSSPEDELLEQPVETRANTAATASNRHSACVPRELPSGTDLTVAPSMARTALPLPAMNLTPQDDLGYTLECDLAA